MRPYDRKVIAIEIGWLTDKHDRLATMRRKLFDRFRDAHEGQPVLIRVKLGAGYKNVKRQNIRSLRHKASSGSIATKAMDNIRPETIVPRTLGSTIEISHKR